MAKRRNKKPKKYHYVYITTNLINGKQYVGDHSTDNLDDGYLGSGRYLAAAVKKYGKENFKLEILEQSFERSKVFKLQEKYINQFNTLTPNGYNIHKTGGTDPTPLNESPEKIQKFLETLKDCRYSPSAGSTIHVSKDTFESNKENLQNKIERLNEKGCYVKLNKNEQES